MKDKYIVRISTFQMNPGDIIIIGSDGKDDILLGYKDDGIRIINEDEKSFLKCVEKCGGNLEKSYNYCLKSGEIIDDFSLLKISYEKDEVSNLSVLPVDHESFGKNKKKQINKFLKKAKKTIQKKDYEKSIQYLENIYRIEPDYEYILQVLINTCLKLRDYEKAAFYAEYYITLYPEKTKYIFITSYCFKEPKNLQKAIDLGERVRLRNPFMLNNLINLAQNYLRIKNYTQTENLISDILTIDPQNSKANKLKQLI